MGHVIGFIKLTAEGATVVCWGRRLPGGSGMKTEPALLGMKGEKTWIGPEVVKLTAAGVRQDDELEDKLL